MALILKQAGFQPLGQFDGVDAITTTVKGGEVGTFTGVASTDKSSAESDGYVPGGTLRPAITTVLPATIDAPLGLIDDGMGGYGTLFGSVLGATAGQQSFGPGNYSTAVGPHTAAASGKLTLWTKPGTYAVTLDAVDTTLNSGLVPSNSALTIGDALFAKVGTGLLSPTATSVVQDLAGDDLVVARFINFETNGSLVTTPSTLVGAAASYTQVVFEFHPALA